jgi:hypothetical protein
MRPNSRGNKKQGKIAWHKIGCYIIHLAISVVARLQNLADKDKTSKFKASC